MLDVYKSPGSPFYEKCAYCESEVGASQFGDIEHWRPKGKVTNELDEIALVTDSDGSKTPHPGYYWLAYDWRNLLYSCLRCNRPKTVLGKRIGKASRFPVNGFRARCKGEESREQPLLLNPLCDDPCEHLEVARNGVMVSKSSRGKMCIEVFGLNLRQRLIAKRADVMRCIDSDIKILMISSVSSSHLHGLLKTKLIKKIRSIQSGSTLYSAAGRSALEYHASLIQQLTGVDVRCGA